MLPPTMSYSAQLTSPNHNVSPENLAARHYSFQSSTEYRRAAKDLLQGKVSSQCAELLSTLGISPNNQASATASEWSLEEQCVDAVVNAVNDSRKCRDSLQRLKEIAADKVTKREKEMYPHIVSILSTQRTHPRSH